MLLFLLQEGMLRQQCRILRLEWSEMSSQHRLERGEEGSLIDWSDSSSSVTGSGATKTSITDASTLTILTMLIIILRNTIDRMSCSSNHLTSTTTATCNTNTTTVATELR